ncbi:DNA/RNA helicase domain-containing protein [Roseomonas sp. BN140053]|uniref:DNA/RNA helicase domain-containing protein n=1 Tax=Roseomonas sp. BN140053 TaxID=3391898 RepID=UPI0039E98674
MKAWFHCSGAELLRTSPADLAARLAAAQTRRGFSGTHAQLAAWENSAALLREAVAACGGEGWVLAFEFELLRLEKRIDAVVLCDRAILVLEFKGEGFAPQALRQAEDYALDLRDFHAGSRSHPIVPLVVSALAPDPPAAQPPLFWHGVVPPLRATPRTLLPLLRWLGEALPVPATPLDAAAWLAAPYRPVPTMIEAATMLFARNGVAEIAAARADAGNLTRTAAAIAAAVAAARRDSARVVVFVSGIPGAGKTLCGLHAVFGPARHEGAAFLTGNTPLVAVLRAALARDAMARGECGRAEAERRVKAALQNVHNFLAQHATDPTGAAPPERMIVFDEAQRAWDARQATRDTQNRKAVLTTSEPAHALEIMARPAGWSAIVALIGGGQEINTGEAGLAEWGRCLAADRRWRAVAAPGVLTAADPAGRLAAGPVPWLALDPALDLRVPIRAVRSAEAAPWVEALLDGRFAEARRIAEAAAGTLPFLLCRDLSALRQGLRALARGERRAGLLRSAGNRRLRADGLGEEVTGDAVPDWFLRRWPDVRASDALEAAATEYACQGLELDVAGLAWGGDFLPAGAGWRARRFVGTAWQAVRHPAEQRFIRNTHRVLLTRARYETVIWVPRGDPEDPTRDPAELDALADRLLGCGARPLAELAAPTGREAAPALL